MILGDRRVQKDVGKNLRLKCSIVNGRRLKNFAEKFSMKILQTHLVESSSSSLKRRDESQKLEYLGS